jgi:hypothetical protein
MPYSELDDFSEKLISFIRTGFIHPGIVAELRFGMPGG